ncbi:MAG: PEP-CTERM sorting domain-containing protein [Verrucomicrobia bacterium]|nr:PEP-CTERM sorting domain-containing protein [Verrucomicrobiota bacterium]
MKTLTNKIGTLMTAGFILGAGAMAHASFIDVRFGSNFDGFGGFSPGGNGDWTELAGGINFLRASGSNSNGALLTQLSGDDALSQEAGSRYVFTSMVQYNNVGSGGSANVSMSLFSGQTNAAFGITLKMFGADNTFQIDTGLNQFNAVGDAIKTWEGEAFGSGALFTLEGMLDFTEDNVDVLFRLTDENGYSDTVSRTLAKGDWSGGNYHGIGTRNAGGNANFDVITFTAAIPEPSTLALLGIALGYVFYRRRRR